MIRDLVLGYLLFGSVLALLCVQHADKRRAPFVDTLLEALLILFTGPVVYPVLLWRAASKRQRLNGQGYQPSPIPSPGRPPMGGSGAAPAVHARPVILMCPNCGERVACTLADERSGR